MGTMAGDHVMRCLTGGRSPGARRLTGGADAEGGGKADGDGFGLARDAFHAVEQDLSGAVADVIGRLDHGGQGGGKEVVDREFIEGSEGNVLRGADAAIAE